jgi:SAM-dependent methyltransferase
MSVDQAKLEQFVGQAATDFAAAFSAVCVGLGDRLGLYRAMAGAGPLSPAELASRTNTPESYLRAWLANQAVGGYVEHDPATGRFTLPDEQAMVLADQSSPVFMCGMARIVTSLHQDIDALAMAYSEQRGFGWHEHSPALFQGTEQLFRPGYAGNLTTAWIPALDGVEAKLRRGAKVADVGCGHGASTVILAQAYPESVVTGYDYHAASIDAAKKNAADAGVADRATFAVAPADSYPGQGFDLVCVFDALHDMGDPVGALTHIRSTLADDGTVLLVEPQAGERLEDNDNPVGRLFYACAATICVPNAASQSGDAPLHPQSPERDHRAVAEQAGFSRFRRATDSPFNRIFELRP